MIRRKIILLLIMVLVVSVVFAANPGRDINNKCRQNLKLLNSATQTFLKKNSDYVLTTWSTYQQAVGSFLDADKYLDGKKIVGPTHDCEYYLISINRNDFQWLCNLHGVIEGDQNLSLKYHEFLLQGKSNSKYMGVENYKKHVQDMVRWTEYTLTPVEFFKYNYNMNPVITTVLTVLLAAVSFYLLKSFFKF